MNGHFGRNVLLFGRLLRRLGLDVHHGRLLDAVPALTIVGVRSRADVKATLRSLLVHRHEDEPRFDAAFDLFFRARRRPADVPHDGPGETPAARAEAGSVAASLDEADAEAGAEERLVGAWSPVEVSREKDFGEFTDRELARAQALLAGLPWALGLRRTRRWERTGGHAIDLRPILRQSLFRGEFADLPRRQRRTRPRPIVLLGDVSGSMERYSRMLVHFGFGLARSEARVESFVFATRLTRLTPWLAGRGRGEALARIVRGVQDWGGGTRIGDALRAFNTRWARRVMRHGPVVLIVSDGWDRGEPEVLARELARVRRSCRRLIWLNPLLGTAGYEPLTRGMQAALRHVDDFLPAHNLASLEQLAAHLRKLPAGRGVGRAAWQGSSRIRPSTREQAGHGAGPWGGGDVEAM
jgi:uncharacterized protein